MSVLRIVLPVCLISLLVFASAVLVCFYPDRVRQFFFGSKKEPPPAAPPSADARVSDGANSAGFVVPQAAATVVLGRPVAFEGQSGPEAA
mmetsp:Transcript_35574/g.101305  ORF Transcript_35574/g.101305 Transcript_35574/m.101305 type:complete len:90 (+) Transcript_35574:73-342(+)